MIKNSKIPILVSLFILLTGCVNLQTLNSYSNNSTEGLKKYDDINFSFKKICENNCELRANSDEKAIANKLSTNYRPIRKESACECENYLKADSAFNKMYFASLQYLEAIQQLSSDDILSFKYDTLANALKKTDLLGVKKEEIDAFNKLVTLTTTLIVDVKRRKDLKNIIEASNAPFQKLLAKLKFAIDEPITLALDTKIELEYNYYKAVVFNKTELSLKDKIELENEFIQKRKTIREKMNLLAEYSKIIDEIKKGHQSVYDNREKIHKKEIAGILGGYVTQIKEIKTSFENIKTEE